jgi:hypothetical protein
MNPGITFKKIWFDDDILELRIDSSNGESLFSNTVYVGHHSLMDLVEDLNNFRDHVHGGILNIQFGEFGPEYANGAFHARLHYHEVLRIHITIRAQSEFSEFGMKSVASESTLHLISETALIDKFISELTVLSNGRVGEARLGAV